MQPLDCMAFTGRVARLIPLPTARSAACPFNAAKLPGVSRASLLHVTGAHLQGCRPVTSAIADRAAHSTS